MKKSKLKEYIREIILAELKIEAKSDELSDLKTKPGDEIKITNESEKEPSETEIEKEKSLAKTQTEFTENTKKLKELEKNMRDTVEKWKNAADNDEKQELLDQLKKLTGEKKELEAKINRLKTIKI